MSVVIDAGIDKLTIEQAQNGDHRAFKKIMEAYFKKTYNLAFQIAGNYADAEDITQETMIRLYKKINKFRWQSLFSTWLYRLTLNVAKNYVSRKKPTYEIKDNIKSEELNPFAVAGKNEMEELLQSAIQKLPWRLKTALVLHDIEGVPEKEIANILHCPVGTVYSHVFHGRRCLKRIIEPYIKEEQHK